MENVISKSYDIAFPNLGIFIETLKNSFKIGNFSIAYYGIIIAIAMLVGFIVTIFFAKKTKQNEDYYYDIFIIIIILGIVGARIYYVLFNLDYYMKNTSEIIDIRAGGLAVFGGIILSAIGVFVYCFIRKCNFARMIDTSVIGLTIGQAIGRYGNFFNMEAFGSYTNNLFAMRMRYDLLDADNVTYEQLLNTIEENGHQYIQAHPTFFYESCLNILLFAILIIVFIKLYKFRGQIFATYLIGYGAIRYFVESLRTDSLMFNDFKVSQLVAIVAIVLGIVIYILYFIKVIKPISLNDYIHDKNKVKVSNEKSAKQKKVKKVKAVKVVKTDNKKVNTKKKVAIKSKAKKK